MMDAPTTITNSTFSGNKATATDYSGNGGAMALYGPTNIINTTIANNWAGWVGGGVAANDSPVTVQNTIFANNTAANGNNNWGIQQQTSRLLTTRTRPNSWWGLLWFYQLQIKSVTTRFVSYSRPQPLFHALCQATPHTGLEHFEQ